MKKFEQYKRIIKFGFAMVIVLLEIAIYAYVWYKYYNPLLENPFWRRGNWLIIVLYGMLLLFFLKTYGGLKIGFLKKGNLIYSQILSVLFVNIVTYIQIALIDKKFHNVLMILVVTLLDVLAIVVWTFVFQWIYGRIFPARRMLYVHGNRSTSYLRDKINSREDKYQICRNLDYRCGMERLFKEIDKYDAVIIDDIPSHERNRLIKECYNRSIRTYSAPKISDILIRSSGEMNLFDSPLLLSKNDGLQIEQKIVKRLLDIAISATGLLISSPLFLLIAISIKCTDRGPVFYKQKRLTQGGKEFKIYKFRTMIQDAEKGGKAVLARDEDDRILPVGKILRRLRLDELPQLWNILKGDMSMVGPRPERPELMAEIVEEIPEFVYRLKVKAGLTGYAQVYGKYNTTPYDKLKLDMLYIENYSFWLDIKILLMTFKVILQKENSEGIDENQITALKREIESKTTTKY